MKKKFVISIALLAVAAVSITAVFAFGLQENKVEYQQETLYGDPSYADGIDVSYVLTSVRNAHWLLKYNLKKNGYDADADFKYQSALHLKETFYKDGGIDDYYDSDEAEYNSHFYVYMGFNETALENMFREEFEKEDFIDQLVKKVKLKDVQDYYEPNAGFHFDKMNTYGLNSTLPVALDSGERAFWDKFYDYFKIPVIDGEVLEVTGFRTNRTNSSNNIAMNIHNDFEQERFEFVSKSILADDALYFTISNRISGTSEIKYADFSQVPGGYGIYKLPYNKALDTSPSFNAGVADISKLQTIFSLEETLQVENMGLSSDGSHLYLIVTDDSDRNNSLIFKSINLKTFKQDQEIALAEDSSYHYVIQKNNFVVLHIKNKAGVDYLKVVYEQSPGVYELFLDTVMKNQELELWSMYKPSCACNGKRFAMCNLQAYGADINQYYSSLDTSTGLELAVYENNELKYFGLYTSSLDDCNVYNLYANYEESIWGVKMEDDGQERPGISHSMALMQYFTEGDGRNSAFNFNLRNTYNRISVSFE